MDVYAAVTIVALSTATGMFLADRLYVFCVWWKALARLERAEQKQPDSGLSLLDAPPARSLRRCHHKSCRKSFADHVDDALDVFPADDDPEAELLNAVVQLQLTESNDLYDLFLKETAR